MTLPFLAAAVDLFARCRRRRIPLAPALRALRTRLAFWAGRRRGVRPPRRGRRLARRRRPAARARGRGRPGPGPSLALAVLGVDLVRGVAARARRGSSRGVPPRTPRSSPATPRRCSGSACSRCSWSSRTPTGSCSSCPRSMPGCGCRSSRDRGPVAARRSSSRPASPGCSCSSSRSRSRLDLGFDAPWYLASLVTVGYVPAVPAALLLAFGRLRRAAHRARGGALRAVPERVRARPARPLPRARPPDGAGGPRAARRTARRRRRRRRLSRHGS